MLMMNKSARKSFQHATSYKTCLFQHAQNTPFSEAISNLQNIRESRIL